MVHEGKRDEIATYIQKRTLPIESPLDLRKNGMFCCDILHVEFSSSLKGGYKNEDKAIKGTRSNHHVVVDNCGDSNVIIPCNQKVHQILYGW